MKTLAVGDTVHIPDRIVHAWGKILEIEHGRARVKIEHSATTRGRITWYPLADLCTPSEHKRRRRGLA